VKSESKVPFLQISERDGDLVLTTEQGIYPDKIDKGCLIINHGRADGFSVYLFDKSGGNTQFWVRDFIGAKPVTNDDFLTRRFSELCVEFAKRGLPEETLAEERMEVASRAMTFLKEADEFDLAEFEEVYSGMMTMSVEHPQIIGFGWCGWFETPHPGGRSGIVDVRTDEPHPDILAIVKKWNSWMAEKAQQWAQ
jgi:hypothetical protein